MDKEEVKSTNFTNSDDSPNQMTVTCHCVNVKCKVEILPPEPVKPDWPLWLACRKYNEKLFKIPKATSTE